MNATASERRIRVANEEAAMIRATHEDTQANRTLHVRAVDAWLAAIRKEKALERIDRSRRGRRGGFVDLPPAEEKYNDELCHGAAAKKL